MKSYLRQYLEYIRNTSRDPLPINMFDDDWEPVGPTVRRDLVTDGLVVEDLDGLRLTDAARAVLDEPDTAE